jgi:hypothetical protein
MAKSKIIKDASGLYNLDHVGSIHPINLKGDKADQSKVTGQHTLIAMNGGQTHHTTIPWAAASAIATDYWNNGADSKPAAAAASAAPISSTPLRRDPPLPLSEEDQANAQAEFTG